MTSFVILTGNGPCKHLYAEVGELKRRQQVNVRLAPRDLPPTPMPDSGRIDIGAFDTNPNSDQLLERSD